MTRKRHDYDGKSCIHAVGPDLRRPGVSVEQALAELRTVYRNVLHEYIPSEQTMLRLPPLSSGIFKGEFGSRMPRLTASALPHPTRSTTIFGRV